MRAHQSEGFQVALLAGDEADEFAAGGVDAQGGVFWQLWRGGRGLAEAQGADGLLTGGVLRQMLHQCITGQQQGVALLFGERGKAFDAVAVFDLEAGGGGAAQGGEIGQGVGAFGNVFGEGADVGAFAALHADLGFGELEAEDLDVVDMDVAGLALDIDALAGVLVEGFALVLEGGIHGGQLLLCAEVLLAGYLKLGLADFGVAGGDDAAFGITGIGGLAEAEDGDVGFVGIEQVLGEFGGLAEADGEQAGGQRIEHAGVTGFFGTVEAAGLLEGAVAGEAGGFVEQEDAVEGAFLRFHCVDG